MKLFFLIIFVWFYFVLSYASNPCGYDFVSYNIGFDSIEIDDKPIPNCYDSIPRITINLSLPLVKFKDYKVADKLQHQFLYDYAGEYKYIMLFQRKLSRKNRFFRAEVVDDTYYSDFLEKRAIGYTLIDSVVVIMDESVKPCLKIDKCISKDFQIEVGNPRCDPSFTPEPLFYFDLVH